MKNKITQFLATVLAISLFISCQKQGLENFNPTSFPSSDSNDAALNINECQDQLEPWHGYCFEQIPHTTSESEGDLLLINKTLGVQALSELDGVISQHWKYRSPSFEDRHIGFSVVYTNTENAVAGSMEVVLFLHGNGGDENGGSGAFFDQYQQTHPNRPTAFIFANGISRITNPVSGDKGFSWKKNKQSDTGLMVDHTQLNLELIAGVLNNDAKFPLMSKNIEDWSVFGFSVGAGAALAMYLDPIFQNEPAYQAKQIFCFAGWMGPSLVGYFDLINGMDQIGICNTNSKLIFAHHVDDNGNDCSVTHTVDLFRETLELELVANSVAYIHLELASPPAGPCDPDTGNPAHNAKFYLNHRKVATSPNNITLNASCYDETAVNNLFNIVSELLYN